MAASSVRGMSRIGGFNSRIVSLLCRFMSSDYSCNSLGLSKNIDIGLSIYPHTNYLQVQNRSKILKKNRNNAELEQLARQRKLQVPLHDVEVEWQKASGPHHIQDIVRHFNIFKDLFDMAEFLCWVVMNITYEVNENNAIPVYWGNVVTPQEAERYPVISYESNAEDWWTLLLTNPDGNLYEHDGEVLHWLVTNIPGQSVSDGEILCDYIQPFPPKGTGYHRFVYLLFKQEQKIDFSEEQRLLPCSSLHARTFNTLAFYRKYQHIITPAGVNFFQCRWDKTVTSLFHHQLEMQEPSYEYNPLPLYIAPQVKWPHKKPLKYLDRYRPQD